MAAGSPTRHTVVERRTRLRADVAGRRDVDHPGGEGLQRQKRLPRSADDQRAEIELFTTLGATDADWDRYPEEPDLVVLADTEGNPFCVIDKTA
jgi:hypothetical protein